MERVIPKLYASAPEPLGFGPDLEIRAFLLQRDAGNVLIYRSAELKQYVDQLNELGGISRQYLNHSHEASPVTDWVADTFNAPLILHERDAPEAVERGAVHETFSERHALDDFEVIPVPGHTPGATVYLWDTDEHRVLFTGDTILFSRGKWVAAVLDGISDRAAYLDSLKTIRSLEFDLIVPGIASAGDPYYEVIDSETARRKIEQIIERLQDGKNG